MFSLLVPSGCGKTTSLRLVAGFEMPTSGAIFICGARQGFLPANQCPVKTVFQHNALFHHMTVTKNVRFGLEMQKVSQLETQRRVGEEVKMAQLNRPEEGNPSQLWGKAICHTILTFNTAFLIVSTGENESQDISSIDAVRALLAENPKSLENPVWAYSLVVEVLVPRAGRIILCRYRSHHPSQEDWGGESVYYKNVGLPLSIGAQLIADGKATAIGVSPPEKAMPTQDLINELDKRDINVEEEIIETGSCLNKYY